MPELFIPKPLDLLTPALQIRQQQQQGQFRQQQLGQGQQRLDLLREDLSLKREQAGAQQKQQQFQNILNTTGKLIDLKLNSQAVDHLNANKDTLRLSEKIISINPTEKAGTYKVDTKKGATIITLDRDAQGNYKTQIIETGVKAKDTTTDKTGQNYLLPSGQTVLSYDGGRTYRTTQGDIPMPEGTVKVPGGATIEGIRVEKARELAKTALEGEPALTTARSPEEAARGGTGPYRAFAAAIDAIAGGLGADRVFGRNGLFPDTQKNRQFLRTIKQLGKSALINSSRGAVWEQEKIDKLFANPDKIFRNPRTEANKFQVIRDTLTIERNFNNQAIVDAVSLKEITKLRESNNEISRLLALLGGGEQQGNVTSTGNRFTIEEVQ